MKTSMLLTASVLVVVTRRALGQSGGGSGDDDSSGVGTGAGEGSELCAEDGTSGHYEENLSGSGSTMVRIGASETGCPNHVNWRINPNDAQVTPSNESIPAYPLMFANGSTTDLSSTHGGVGIMRNGVALFSSWASDTVVGYKDTAFYLEADSFDLCGGHATSGGIYHYHSTAGCLQEQAIAEAGVSAEGHSPVLGWAYDGFPVYGQLGPGGVEMKMCGEDGADDTHCLDLCSGYEKELPRVDGFKYRYYLSCGFDESFFPFTTNCYRGCCPDGVTCSDSVEACGDFSEEGYTAEYVPEAYPTLAEPYDAALIEGNDTLYIDSSYSVNCTLYLGGASTGATPATTTPVPSPAPDASTSPPSSAAIDAATPSPTANVDSAIDESPAPVSAADGTDGAVLSLVFSAIAIAMTAACSVELIV